MPEIKYYFNKLKNLVDKIEKAIVYMLKLRFFFLNCNPISKVILNLNLAHY